MILDDTTRPVSSGAHRPNAPSILEERILDLESQLREARATISSERARADGWLSAVSHDLRGPLTLLLGHSQQAIDRLGHGRSVDLVPDDLRSIQRATRRIAIILDQIVDAARIEQDCLDLLIEPADVTQITRGSVVQIRRAYPDHRFRTSIAGNLPLANADRPQLARVLGILLNNAASFSDTGSVIRITARQSGGGVVMSVSDLGVGLSSDELRRVFDRSYRPARYAHVRRDGLGLSLWIAKALVGKMGGELTVGSDGPNLGTTFRVRLALSDEADIPRIPRLPHKPE